MKTKQGDIILSVLVFKSTLLLGLLRVSYLYHITILIYLYLENKYI